MSFSERVREHKSVIQKAWDINGVKNAVRFGITAGGLCLSSIMAHEIWMCSLGVPSTIWSPYVQTPEWALAPCSFALNLDGDIIYWVEGGHGMIIESPLNTKYGATSWRARFEEMRPVVSGLQAPRSVAFHPVTRTLYWTDVGSGKVQRVSLRDNATRGLNHSTHEDVLNISDPTGIALDYLHSPNGTTWVYTGSGGANEDAVVRRILVNDHVSADLQDVGTSSLVRGPAEIVAPYSSTDGAVGGLALDLAREKIYWSLTEGRRIHRANLDGSGAERFIDSDTLERPEALAFNARDDYLYWSDPVGRKIMRAATQDAAAVAENVWKSTSAHTPRGLVLEEDEGMLYWGDFAVTGILHGDVEGECWLIKLMGQKIVSMMFMALAGCFGISATVVCIILLLGAYSGQCLKFQASSGHVQLPFTGGRSSGHSSGGHFQPAVVGIVAGNMMGDMARASDGRGRRTSGSVESKAEREERLQRGSVAVLAVKKPHPHGSDIADTASMPLALSPSTNSVPLAHFGSSVPPPSDEVPSTVASVGLRSSSAGGPEDGIMGSGLSPGCGFPPAPQGAEIMASVPEEPLGAEQEPLGHVRKPQFLQREDEPLDVDNGRLCKESKCCVSWFE